MGRSQQYERVVKKTGGNTHPIWRGIGFLLIVLISVMSYAGASLLVKANQTNAWVAVPPEIQGGVPWAPNLYAELIITFFLMMIGFVFLTIFYSIIYKATRPRDPNKMVK
jgi:hypothetical protein